MPDFLTRMTLANRISHVARSTGACTEIHCRPNGQLAVECRVEAPEKRFYDVFVELDGSLSLGFFRGGEVIEATGLQLPTVDGAEETGC